MRPHTLILNADYGPHNVVQWKDGITYVVAGTGIALVNYKNEFIRSPRVVYPQPAVVLFSRLKSRRPRVRFKAENVLARDCWFCTFCGTRPTKRDGSVDRDALTMDHVIPKSVGRKNGGRVWLPWAKKWVPQTCWLNAVTACEPCNRRKGNHAPAEAHMALRYMPRNPTAADVLRMKLARVKAIPEEWDAWLPSGWRNELGVTAVENVARTG